MANQREECKSICNAQFEGITDSKTKKSDRSRRKLFGCGTLAGKSFLKDQFQNEIKFSESTTIEGVIASIPNRESPRWTLHWHKESNPTNFLEHYFLTHAHEENSK